MSDSEEPVIRDVHPPLPLRESVNHLSDFAPPIQPPAQPAQNPSGTDRSDKDNGGGK